MKVTKKLVTSIICLVLSLAFCVWAVFAWFSANNAVDADGIQTSVTTENVTLTVTVYLLENADDTSGGYNKTDIVIFSNNTNIDYKPADMPDYGGTGCTAVLLEITVNYTGTTAQSVPVSVMCNNFKGDQNNTPPTYLDYVEKAETTPEHFVGNLSDAMSVYGTTVYNNSTYTKGNVNSFLTKTAAPYGKIENLSLYLFTAEFDGTTNAEVTKNYIMDYNSDLMSVIYTWVGDMNQGDPSTEVYFETDLIFVAGEQGTGSGITGA